MTPTAPPLSDPLAAQLDDVTLRHTRRGHPALDRLTATIRPGTITGLVGRNGAGKTSLMSLLAGHLTPTRGAVTVGTKGAMVAPFEDSWAISSIAFVREAADQWGTTSITELFDYHAQVRPTWSTDLAAELLDAFGLEPQDTPDQLSRGQRSAVSATIGLASRAPLTLLDEVTLGMDATNRALLADALLTDYSAHPRTIVLSSHLIDEIAPLLEDVLVLDRGRVALSGALEDVQARGLSVTGPTAKVEAFLTGRAPLSQRSLGGVSEASLLLDVGEEVPPAPDEAQGPGTLAPEASTIAAARAAGLAVATMPLQDLVVAVGAADAAPPSPTAPTTTGTTTGATTRDTTGTTTSTTTGGHQA